MKRKDYERPTMKVVELQHMQMLMTSEPMDRSRLELENYNVNNYEEE